MFEIMLNVLTILDGEERIVIAEKTALRITDRARWRIGMYDDQLDQLDAFASVGRVELPELMALALGDVTMCADLELELEVIYDNGVLRCPRGVEMNFGRSLRQQLRDIVSDVDAYAQRLGECEEPPF